MNDASREFVPALGWRVLTPLGLPPLRDLVAKAREKGVHIFV